MFIQKRNDVCNNKNTTRHFKFILLFEQYLYWAQRSANVIYFGCLLYENVCCVVTRGYMFAGLRDTLYLSRRGQVNVNCLVTSVSSDIELG